MRESEGRHRTILESITDAFFALDRDWRFTYVNRQAEALLGRSRGDLLGKDFWEEYAPTLGTGFEHGYRRAMDQGVAVAFEEFYPPHDRWYEVHAYPRRTGCRSTSGTPRVTGGGRGGTAGGEGGGRGGQPGEDPVPRRPLATSCGRR